MTPADLYIAHFNNPEPKFFGMIPHIVDHLTYDEVNPKTGKVEVKRLSLQAIQLYRILKQTAGEDGACWKNRDTLAEQANMSAGSISKAKEELKKNFHQLDNTPLIKIEEVKKKGTKNATIYHRILILDIWKWNNAFMATLKYQKDKALSPNDGANEALSPNDGATQGALSPGDTNNNPLNKNPLSKQQQPPAVAGIVASSKAKNRLFPSEDKKKIYEHLVKHGCHESTSYGIAIKYSLDEFKKSLDYTCKALIKSPKENKWGYLQTVLKNKYWDTKK